MHPKARVVSGRGWLPFISASPDISPLDLSNPRTWSTTLVCGDSTNDFAGTKVISISRKLREQITHIESLRNRLFSWLLYVLKPDSVDPDMPHQNGYAIRAEHDVS